jgi:hypothetical protein
VWSSTNAAIEWAYAHLGTELCETCPRSSGKSTGDARWNFVI